MFAVRQDDSLVEITCETAVIDFERFGMAAGGANLARLPGRSAKIRFTEGQEVRIIALLPGAVDPRRLELQSFEYRGMTRVSYIGPFKAGPGANWNARSFRAQQLKDGRWLLEPASQLRPGEYCFSPKFNYDNFCFGVDKK